MSFTIVIPLRNAENLKACIEAIRASGCEAYIDVIDDTELGDYSIFDVSERDDRVLLSCGKKPFCFSANVNIGIAKAGTEDVIVINDDALLVDPDQLSTLDEMVVYVSNSKAFGIVSAAVIGAVNSHELTPIDSGAPTLREIKGKMVPFVCVYIPRRTIDRVGLLDERFCGVYGGEDNQYCYRVRQAGLKIGVYDGCVVDHGTLPSTFRPDGKGRDITETKKRFREIMGFEMDSR